MPEFLSPVTQEEYDQSGSKFVTIPPGEKEVYLDIETGLLGWEQQGVSMKLPITITEEGPDKGKQEKISFGVSAKAIWKGKLIYEAVAGEPMPMKKGADGVPHPAPNSDALLGKAAVGHWIVVEGHKGGDPSAEVVSYPKLQDIFPAGQKPTTESLT